MGMTKPPLRFEDASIHLVSIKNWLRIHKVELNAIVLGAMHLDIYYQPSPSERLFDLDVYIINTVNTGAVYCIKGDIKKSSMKKLIGLEYNGNNISNPMLEILVIDSLIPKKMYCPLF